MVSTARSIEITKVRQFKSRVLMYSYATRGLGFLVHCATISRQLGQRSGGSPLFMINHRSSYIYNIMHMPVTSVEQNIISEWRELGEEKEIEFLSITRTKQLIDKFAPSVCLLYTPSQCKEKACFVNNLLL